jgi:hypothetical protein
MATKNLAGTKVAVRTIPQVTLNGADSVQDALPTGAYALELDISEVNWAYTGGDALRYDLSVSFDGGQTWEWQTGDTITDDPIPASKGNAANTFKITTSLEAERGGVQRIGRLAWQAFKPVKVSGSVNIWS